MDKFVVYKGNDDQYYWRLVASNGRIVAIGGEGFVTRSNATRAAENVVVICKQDPPIEDEQAVDTKIEGQQHIFTTEFTAALINF